jgi:hypothetical protein
LKDVCYARYGPLAHHWAQVNSGQRGGSFDQFIDQIRALPTKQLWRHNEAGDLPGHGDQIDVVQLRALVDANCGKRGFTYTHKPVLNNPHNALAIKCANQLGFTINLSADSVKQGDELMKLGIGPVVVVLPENTNRSFLTPAGNRVVVCLNALNKTITCRMCQLCQRADRAFIIGFPVHGNGKKYFTS